MGHLARGGGGMAMVTTSLSALRKLKPKVGNFQVLFLFLAAARSRSEW
jgi:hypothetical protein